jgi:WhiB family transcriptional regulator, redox-sensing transcriptional regulator
MALGLADLRNLALLFGSDDPRYLDIGTLIQWAAVKPAWMKRAACRDADPELFFPTKGVKPTEAKAICATCPVASECYEYATADRFLHGVWASTTKFDRRKLREANDQAA